MGFYLIILSNHNKGFKILKPNINKKIIYSFIGIGAIGFYVNCIKITVPRVLFSVNSIFKGNK
jgi:hypothetical protein